MGFVCLLFLSPMRCCCYYCVYVLYGMVIFHLEIGWIPFWTDTPRFGQQAHMFCCIELAPNCGHSVAVCFDVVDTLSQFE